MRLRDFYGSFGQMEEKKHLLYISHSSQLSFHLVDVQTTHVYMVHDGFDGSKT